MPVVPVTREAKVRGWQFGASVGKVTARSYLKKKLK
jgi:hypothetical protein